MLIFIFNKIMLSFYKSLYDNLKIHFHFFFFLKFNFYESFCPCYIMLNCIAVKMDEQVKGYDVGGSNYSFRRHFNKKVGFYFTLFC